MKTAVQALPQGGTVRLPVHDIAPSRGWAAIDFGELWAYRELLYLLVWRQVKIRYKQTLLGVAWAVIQPVLAMVVFSIFFGRLGKLSSDGVPYPVFAYAALLPWQLFAFALTESAGSVVANQALVSKVYFPRLLMPVATVGVGLLDFVVSAAVLAALMAWYGVAPGVGLWSIPLWTGLAVVTALGAGLWLSALNVRFRDVRYTVTFLTQVWLFATPVAYSISLVPESWRTWYALNPMVGVVGGFRWALLGAPAPGATALVSGVIATALLLSGAIYFTRTERTFADLV